MTMIGYTGDVDVTQLREVVEQAERTKGRVKLVVGVNAPAVASIECVPGDHEYAVSVSVDLAGES